MRKSSFKRFIKIFSATVMTVMIAVTSCGCSGLSGKPIYDYGNGEAVRFEDMKYERPDTSKFDESVARALEYSNNVFKGFKMIGEINAMSYELEHMICMYSLAEIRASLDITDEALQEEQTYCSLEYSKMYSKYMECFKKLLESKNSYLVNMMLDTVFKEQIENYVSPDEDYEDLLEKEESIIQTYTDDSNTAEYQAAIAKAVEEFYFSNDRKALYNTLGKLYAERNTELGELYVDLVKTRRSMYDGKTFETCLDYYYDQYMRDVSADEADNFCGYVKQYLAPLYASLRERAREAANNDIFSVQGTYSGDNALDSIGENISAISEDMKNVFDYMRENNLVDVSKSDTKMNASFTTYISGYNVPFLFSYYYDSVDDYLAIVHEFGHYYEEYINCDATNNIDVKEIHSQGLELLYMSLYDKVFPADSVEDLKDYKIIDMLYSIISGCLYDEFQRYAYSADDLTLDDLNKKFEELSVAYGIVKAEDVTDYHRFNWVDVHHNYIAPFYYLSYAVSAYDALNIFIISESDSFEKAKEKYFEIVNLGSGYGIKALSEKAGLGSMFEEEEVKKFRDFFADHFSEYIGEEKIAA